MLIVKRDMSLLQIGKILEQTQKHHFYDYFDN